MPTPIEGELAVDVLVIGSGMMATYLARSVAGRYSVCVLTEPGRRPECLDGDGWFSAGYDGNDVARIQPARRAAGYWRLWAESNGLSTGPTPVALLAAGEAATRPRLWSDAALVYRRADALPAAFAGGARAADLPYQLENDVVLHPAAVLAQLRREVEDRCLPGDVVRFGLAADAAVDHVEVDVAGETLVVVPRFTVLAADGANAGLLHKVAVRLRQADRRKAAIEAARTSQAVRHQQVVCVRAEGLPVVAAEVDGLRVVSHELDGRERLWVVAAPVDDGATTLGEEDLRFAVAVDHGIVADVGHRLLAASPALADLADRARWAAYGRRLTQHPMMAVDDTGEIAQPAPARIESLDLEGFLALWPSHDPYAMIVGDVAAERVAEQLGPTGDFSSDLSPAALAPPLRAVEARWEGTDLAWTSWDDFSFRYGIKG